mmetsp:Transcript_4331/g.7378  ORF Transcript_4331/g.7378 Transcript_4331/m.7378 type:complete len:232 (-) Transcript_4331:1466-2161(-)
MQRACGTCSGSMWDPRNSFIIGSTVVCTTIVCTQRTIRTTTPPSSRSPSQGHAIRSSSTSATPRTSRSRCWALGGWALIAKCSFTHTCLVLTSSTRGDTATLKSSHTGCSTRSPHSSTCYTRLPTTLFTTRKCTQTSACSCLSMTTSMELWTGSRILCTSPRGREYERPTRRPMWSSWLTAPSYCRCFTCRSWAATSRRAPSRRAGSSTRCTRWPSLSSWCCACSARPSPP